MVVPVTIPLGITNCYLLKSPKGYFLIDTGFKNQAQFFMNQLRAKKFMIADIGFIFLTHHHKDHAGLIDFCTKQNPQVRIIMHEATAGFVDIGINHVTPQTVYPTRRMNYLYRMVKNATKNIDTKCLYKERKNDIIVHGDDDRVLCELGINGKILHTPGHTEDSISLFIDGIGIFCGDACVNQYGFTGNRNVPILFEDIEVLYESWKKIIDTGARIIYPAHGNKFSVDILKRNIYKLRTTKHPFVLRK
jgi:hydroxyacylglutathione hydrolase